MNSGTRPQSRSGPDQFSFQPSGLAEDPLDPQNCPLLAPTRAAALVEDTLVLVQDQLHNLVLEDHEHGDVGRLCLGSEQRGSKDDGHVLNRHPIVVAVANHPVGERAQSSDGTGNRKWTLTAALTCVDGQRGASWYRGWE